MIIEIYDAKDSDGVNPDMGEDSLNMTDRSEIDDDDKVFYTKIGKTELPIDKILTNLLV